MDLDEALQRRRMVRSFDGSAVDEEQLTKLFEESLRAPTAGNARGISWVLGIGSPAVRDYFLASTDATWRSNSARFAGLARASAVALCVMEPDRYVQRYGESDNSPTGLAMPVPRQWPRSCSSKPKDFPLHFSGHFAITMRFRTPSLFLGRNRSTEQS